MAASAPQLTPDLDLLSPPEAAELLRLPTHRTMERWRSEGTGPAFVKVGRRVAYRRADLQQWLEQQVRQST